MKPNISLLQRILVSVTNDLVFDQRTQRVCATLSEMGHEIVLIGRRDSKSLPIDRPYHTHRLRLVFNKGFLFYAEFNIRLFLKLLFAKKDILFANDVDTILPNYLVSRIFSKKLIFDSHELFSEIPELVERPKVRAVWKWIENRTIPKLKNCITVSESIAEYYKDAYQTIFTVIRNFPEREPSNSTEYHIPELTDKYVIIYQGSLNVGRGLELMIETMNLLDQTVFLIVGDGDISGRLHALVKELKIEDKVLFLGRKRPSDLKRITPLADVGISLEEDIGLNYRYALPNKLFDYIQAEIPLVVSDLPEMKRVVLDHDLGLVFEERTPENLANTISSILQNGKDHWKNQLKRASEEFVWEQESNQLKNLMNDLK